MSKRQRKLSLNRRHKMIGGVCAGLAEYFDIPRFVVRLIFIVATMTWGLTLLAYIALYFLLDSEQDLKSFGRDLADNKVINHFRDVNYQKKLYKNKAKGKIKGVCAGIADYLEIKPIYVRLMALASLFFGPLAVLVYIAAAIFLDDGPVSVHSRNDNYSRSFGEADYYRSSTDSDINVDIDSVSTKFSDVEQKLRRLEASITSKRFKLHSEFKHMENGPS